MRYRAFADELRLKYRKKVPDSVHLVFYMPMPASWSKKKRADMNHEPHQAKPDIDNLIKSVLDALCEDDSYVFRVYAEKYWSEVGGIEIEEV